MRAENSALDAAWADHVAGRSDDAVRRCVDILNTDPEQIGAASLIAMVLHAKGRDVSGTLSELARRHADRGDLPRAVALARLLVDPSTLREIAEIYGLGSPRLADVAPVPPPLPLSERRSIQVQGDLTTIADGALAAHLATDAPPRASVPRLPLFSGLPKKELEMLLAAFTTRTLAADQAAIEEGHEGREAFVVVRGHLRAERRGEVQQILAELGPGAIFGEMALVSDAPRAASVTALDPVVLLVASRDALEVLAKKAPEIDRQLSEFCRARMIDNLMRHSPLLKSVPSGERAVLLARFEARRFRVGESLVAMGQEPAGLYLVASGAVQVLGRDADGDALQIAELGAGDVVGEMSLVLRRSASADVVALHPTVALELSRDAFQDAIRAHPALLTELYDLAAKRDDEMRSVVAQETLDVESMVLV